MGTNSPNDETYLLALRERSAIAAEDGDDTCAAALVALIDAHLQLLEAHRVLAFSAWTDAQYIAASQG